MPAVGTGCLGKAADDEPVFILRACRTRSRLTPFDHWANHAQLVGVHPDKVREARELAGETICCEWPNPDSPAENAGLSKGETE
jgi:hypothetical protein